MWIMTVSWIVNTNVWNMKYKIMKQNQNMFTVVIYTSNETCNTKQDMQ